MAKGLVQPALAWFLVAGLGVFGPMFAISLLLASRQRAPGETVLAHQHWLPTERAVWAWVLGGTLAVMAAMGGIMVAWSLLERTVGLPPLQTTPPTLAFDPFAGRERMFLLAWLPKFFLNEAAVPPARLLLRAVHVRRWRS